MKTIMAKEENIERQWYIINGNGVVLGRLATQVATILRGKHKPIFTPYVDTGDYVIIINVGKIVLTGNKRLQKFYYTHSGYPGGLKSTQYKKLMDHRPELAIKLAVKGMLPHNSLGRKMLKKMKVYREDKHPHQAQHPKLFNLKGKD